ncbi:MAG: hypothetical protein LBJ25_06815 [Candidatus Margulisbacteria bacterium]|jgi:hypothetical protein|nr:hypothetical protein [Candidatus Margulisiibacteriota bacterium]
MSDNYFYQPTVNSKVDEQIARLGKFCIKSGLSNEQQEEYQKILKNFDADILEKVVDGYVSDNIPSRGMLSISEIISMYHAADKKTKTAPVKNCLYCKTFAGYIFVERWKNNILRSTSVCACPYCEAGKQKNKRENVAYYSPNENYILALTSELDFAAAQNDRPDGQTETPAQLDFGGEVKQLAENFSF